MHRYAIALLLPIIGAIALASTAPRPVPASAVTSTEPAEIGPDDDLRAVATAVANTMVVAHYSRGAIDDERSREWLDAYLKDLDGQRLYLLREDIDEFSKWSTVLDDDILSAQPSLEAPYFIHQRYRDRVRDRIVRILALLDQDLPLDGSLGTVQVDRAKAEWAVNEAELDVIWRKRLAEQILAMKMGEERAEDPVLRLKKRYERIGREAGDIAAEDILESWLGALTRTFDPHSTWFKPVSKENFDIEMRDTLTGIGAELNTVDGYVTISKLIDGGPAMRSGLLRPKDTILAVAQGDAPPVDIVEMRLDKAVQLIRGKEGTDVVLTIHPVDAADASETRQVRIKREKVKLAQSAAKGEIREMPSPGGPLHLGVIDVPSFYVDTEGQRAGDPNWGSTARDVAKLIGQWAGSIDAVVLDLRHNGGGSLDQALELTGLFLDSGPVVQIRDHEGSIEVLRDPSPGALWTGPVVILTSELSASASEIVAAALQDHGRAIVVGSPITHGKGSVQNLIGLARHLTRSGRPQAAERAGAVKFTSHMFFRVNGDSTQQKGVAADVALPSYYEGLDILESDLPHALPWSTIPAARYTRQPQAFDLQALRTASAQRVSEDAEFGFLREDVSARRRYRDDNELALDLDRRIADQAKDKERDVTRDNYRRERGWDGQAEIDVTLDESLRVTRDYVLSLHGQSIVVGQAANP